jgi:hypothetical protein
MKNVTKSVFAAMVILASTSAFAGGQGNGIDIGVGVGDIYQTQTTGQKNTQDAAIGFVDSGVDNAKVYVGTGMIAQTQTGGNDNAQKANIGVVCDCTPGGQPKHP